MSDILIRNYRPEDEARVKEILNHEILHTAAFYHLQPLSDQELKDWIGKKLDAGRPLLIAELDSKAVGFATFDTFRDKPAGRLALEHSLYVHHLHRGKGIGKKLLEAIIETATNQGYHTMIGAIDSENDISIQLHRQYGFETCGTIRHAAYKFDRWLNLVFMQRMLQ